LNNARKEIPNLASGLYNCPKHGRNGLKRTKIPHSVPV